MAFSLVVVVAVPVVVALSKSPDSIAACSPDSSVLANNDDESVTTGIDGNGIVAAAVIIAEPIGRGRNVTGLASSESAGCCFKLVEKFIVIVPVPTVGSR